MCEPTAIKPIDRVHRLQVYNGKLHLDGKLVHVGRMMCSGQIRIGCTYISPEAFAFIRKLVGLDSNGEQTLQEGDKE